MVKAGNFNIPVEANVADEFSDWVDQPDCPFNKGTACTGALKAIQSLFAIDKGLAAELTNPHVSIDQAVGLILDRVSDAEIRRLSEPLSPDQRTQALQDAKASRDRIFRKG